MCFASLAERGNGVGVMLALAGQRAFWRILQQKPVSATRVCGTGIDSWIWFSVYFCSDAMYLMCVFQRFAVFAVF